MPGVKELQKIIEKTPNHHAILIEGIHGIGKSQVVEKYAEENDYKCTVLFLGQMADAGDLIGLPDREKNEDTGYTHTVFRPPFWWPDKKTKRFILFLDELNRGKPEVMQCIMDMVLHRKLMGKDLPENCMIIAAINPIQDDGYYQVDELDPALLDRFKRYEFKPSHEEWMYWAMRNKLHKHVIGFISKNYDMLDPNTDVKSGAKANDIQPSRRSWERVSDVLNSNPGLEEDEELLHMLMIGDVGVNATSRFKKYLKELKMSLSANEIIMKWSSKVENDLKKYKPQDIMWMNLQISYWFKEYEEVIKENKKMASTAMKGLTKYLNIIGNEPQAQFLNILANDSIENKETYGKTLMRLNPNLAENYFNVCHGQEESEEEVTEES